MVSASRFYSFSNPKTGLWSRLTLTQISFDIIINH